MAAQAYVVRHRVTRPAASSNSTASRSTSAVRRERADHLGQPQPVAGPGRPRVLVGHDQDPHPRRVLAPGAAVTSTAPLRLLAVYCGATDWGGAEVMLGHLLASLGPHVEPVLLGVDRDGARAGRGAADRARRCGRAARIRGKRDLRSAPRTATRHAAARPDVVQVNLPVPVGGAVQRACRASRYRGRASWSSSTCRCDGSRGIRPCLKRATAPRLAAHLAVGTATRARSSPCAGCRRSRSASCLTASRSTGHAPWPAARPRVRVVGGASAGCTTQKGFDVLVRAVGASWPACTSSSSGTARSAEPGAPRSPTSGW